MYYSGNLHHHQTMIYSFVLLQLCTSVLHTLQYSHHKYLLCVHYILAPECMLFVPFNNIFGSEEQRYNKRKLVCVAIDSNYFLEITVSL